MTYREKIELQLELGTMSDGGGGEQAATIVRVWEDVGDGNRRITLELFAARDSEAELDTVAQMIDPYLDGYFGLGTK